MKLSEAIRLGAMMRPQTHEQLVDSQGTCAIGAALDAAGALKGVDVIVPDEMNDALWTLSKKHWPVLTSMACPPYLEDPFLNNGQATTVGFIITTLNDDYQWTRERIADWVEKVEIALTAPQPVVEHAAIA